MSKNYTFHTRKTFIALAAISLMANFEVFAQVDAGALQQGLEKQLPLPSPLALPEPERGTSGPTGKAKEGELRFTVTQFDLEGVKILPEAEVQAAIKAWTNTPVTFDDLQNVCDVISELYRKKGYTVQAILQVYILGF